MFDSRKMWVYLKLFKPYSRCSFAMEKVQLWCTTVLRTGDKVSFSPTKMHKLPSNPQERERGGEKTNREEGENFCLFLPFPGKLLLILLSFLFFPFPPPS